MTTVDPAFAGAITFAYAAQTYDGQPMSGTIDAADLNDAARRLEGMRLRVIRLDKASRPPRPRALGREDFVTFNQQLAQLTSAGLPVERGLRLIAEDMRSGRVAQAIHQVADELDRGAPLGEAFAKHQRMFPRLYATLIEAGVRTGNLPAVLLNLGRHLELVQRLRAAVWWAAAYPLMVVAALLAVMILLGRVVLPQMRWIYGSRGNPPGATRVLFWISDHTPELIVVFLVVVIGLPLLWWLLKLIGWDASVADHVIVPLPMVGPVLKRNLIARWCDSLRVAIEAGMDLPAAVTLAGDVVGSPRVRHDSHRIAEAIRSGQPIDQVKHLSLLPLTAVAVVQLAADRNDLPASLATLAQMYQQQAETRLAAMQTSLPPLLILLVAALITIVIVGLFGPLFTMISGPWK